MSLEDEARYLESKHPKPIAAMWEEYAAQFAEHQPEHESQRLKHAFYHCAFALLIDLDKVPREHPDQPEFQSVELIEEQLLLWNEEVSTALDALSLAYFKKHKDLPYTPNVAKN